MFYHKLFRYCEEHTDPGSFKLFLRNYTILDGRPDLTLQCHLRYIRYIAAEGGNVVPESMKQKSKTIFPNDIVAKSRAGTNTLQRLNATSTFTLHLTPDQDNTSQNAFVIIIIPARRSLVVTRSLDLVCLHNRRPLIGSRSVDICCNTAWV